MKRFKVDKKSMILMVFISVLSFIFIGICSYYLNIDEDQLKEAGGVNIPAINVCKDLFIVVVSITGTNLLLNVLIEVKSKNQLLTELVENDVISSPKFYKNMETSVQLKMCQALEYNLYYHDSVKQNMGIVAQSKISKIKDSYYFEECLYMITCNIHDNYVEEDVVKEVIVRSYKESNTITNFLLTDCCLETVDGIIPFELLSVRVNNDLIKLEDIEELEFCSNGFVTQNFYDFSKKYLYKKKISISNNHDTRIIIRYRMRSTCNARFNIFRPENPCKRFSLTYNLMPNSKYRIAASVFGFFEDGSSVINDAADYRVNIEFKNWFFNNEGIVIMILDKG